MQAESLYHCYRIRVRGQLDERWFNWFDGLTVSLDAGGETVIHGQQVDQAGLHAILNRIRDLGLELIAVERCDLDHSEETR